jgi:enterochelin esterase family protein
MTKQPLLYVVLLTAMCAWGAEKKSATELIELANAHSADLAAAIEASFEARELTAGTAWAGRGPEFFFALKAVDQPKLMIDDAPGPAMMEIGDSQLWYAAAQVEPVGRLHAFHYVVANAQFGGALDMPALGPLSYLQPGAPMGKLSDPIEHKSRIYEGMKSQYWVYVPAQYDPTIPAAVMVFQDGQGYIDRYGNNPALNVIDNLIAQKKIPVMICIFINPGDIADAPNTPTFKFVRAHADKWDRSLKDAMRSTEYDTVSDRYVRFLREEILAEVGGKYNLRKDAYSHAITGASSGGICSFNAAWQMPDYFSRVLTWIGSFTSIQWKEQAGISDGGQDYPDKILREPKRNIRVWLQDGANDLSFPKWGDWPLANIRMANSLKSMDYDFHFSFGKGTHNGGHGAAEFPEEMIWLWRDYDAAKTEQEFVADPAEKNKPHFRVEIFNRD